MVEIKRSIRCSNCSNETSFYLSSELALNELQVHGRCQRCGNSLQINYSMVDSSQQTTAGTSSTNSAPADSPIANIDPSMFEPEISSDSIKDLIEES